MQEYKIEKPIRNNINRKPYNLQLIYLGIEYSHASVFSRLVD